MTIKQGFKYNLDDAARTRSLLRLLAGTGILSAGIGASYYGLKKLIDAEYTDKLKKELSPAAAVSELHAAQQTPLSNTLLGGYMTQEPESTPSVAANTVTDSSEDSEKKDAIVDALFFDKKGSVIDTPLNIAAAPLRYTADGVTSLLPSIGYGMTAGVVDAVGAATKGVQSSIADAITSIKNNNILGIDSEDKLTKQELRKIRESSKQSLSAGDKIVAALSAYPNLKPLWALPAGVGLAYGGYYAGKHLLKALYDLCEPKKEKELRYLQQAKEIYADSAKYLHDVSTGKDLDKEAEKDKLNDNTPAKTASLASHGKSSGFSITNPNVYLGILGAGLLARQIKEFRRGYRAAGDEIANSTHMLRAWQATASERHPDYSSNLEIALEEEPTENDALLESILNKERKLKRALNKKAMARTCIKPLL